MANNMNFGVDLLPKSSNTYDLGNSNYKWKNIYATNLHIDIGTVDNNNTYRYFLFTNNDSTTFEASAAFKISLSTDTTNLFVGNSDYAGSLWLFNKSGQTLLIPTCTTGRAVISLPSSTGTLVTGQGTNGYLVKFNGANSITNGPAIGTDTTKFLNNKGEWAVPPDTKSWTSITGKPSTLSGYGITDAKIANGVITLGSNTITPLTSHQDITGKADKSATVSTLAWDSTNKKITKTINGSTTDVVSFAQAGSVTLSGSSNKLTISAKDTTYTFAGGTNSFKVTPAGETAQTITVTPSIANNITGSGTSGSLAKFEGTNILTSGPVINTNADGSKFLNEKGVWAVPNYTTNTDENVKQTNVTNSMTYSLLLSNSAAGTDVETAGVNKSSKLTWNPGTATLTATYISTSYPGATISLAGRSSTSTSTIQTTNGRLSIKSSSTLYLTSGASASMVFRRGTDNIITLDTNSSFRPIADEGASLGTTAYKWSAIYGSQVWGAVWNDYAEFRKDNPKEKELQQPGRCVREVGDGTLTLTDGRLQRGCEIISDTFGFAIGQDKENGYNTPIASSGRVLAYLYEDRELARNFIGWSVCSGPNGTVSIMTEEEENRYSNRIVGTISEIPDYEEWGTGKVKVDGRIWIRIK